MLGYDRTPQKILCERTFGMAGDVRQIGRLNMKLPFPLLSRLVFAFFLAVLLPTQTVFANDHGGGASGPEPLKFVVNLGDPARGGKYLQVQMVFDPATPEIGHELAVLKPRIQHELILMLSSGDANKLITLEGKKELMIEIIDAVNHLLHETEKTGVKDVFFTSFIIQ